MSTIFNIPSIPSFSTMLNRSRASWTVQQQQAYIQRPLDSQLSVLQKLLYKAQNTLFGQAHRFGSINSYTDFKQQVPLFNYSGLVPYIRKLEAGSGNVLWPGRPFYLAKTAGTTGDAKYIPVTRDSLSDYVQAAHNSLLYYIHDTGNTGFLNQTTVALSGNPCFTYRGSLPAGNSEAIIAPYMPEYLQRNQAPSYTANCIEDWHPKVDAIVEETYRMRVGAIAGVPPWIQIYLDRLQERTGMAATELFPDLSLLIHSGMELSPYRTRLLQSLGEQVYFHETYASAEGFIAFQDTRDLEGLLLQINGGIFFEFIPVEEYFTIDNPKRLCIGEVELGKNYVLAMSSNAGLWGYVPGDIVQFVSTDPFRIIIAGHTQHCINAFGEYVIAREVNEAMRSTLSMYPETVLTEFTVAPKIHSEPNAPSHYEWLIEFLHPPKDIIDFAQELDRKMCQLNGVYKRLRHEKQLQPIRLRQLARGTFSYYMHAEKTLGGNNKVVRLANTRTVADALLSIRL